MPSLLSEKFQHYHSIHDDMSLLMKLRDDLADLSAFVISACDDETWCDNHHVFMEKATIVLTRRFFRMRLSAWQAKQLADAFHSHWSILKNVIPKDLTILFKGREYQVNSLLFTVNSEFFKQMVAVECAGNDIKYLKLKNPPIDQEFFELYIRFAEEDDLPDLWQKSPEELLSFMKMAVEIECKPLEKFAADTYKRYLDKSNVYLMSVQAYRCNWACLYRVCQEYVNQLQTGVRFLIDKPGFAVEAVNILDETIDKLEVFEDELTHLTCKGQLAATPLLTMAVSFCSSLVSLDVSEASKGDFILTALNENIESLDLSSSDWLDFSTLEQVIELCPRLVSLNLAKNTQLNYHSWGLLQKLKELRGLGLSSCSQINDSDLKIILQACTKLQDLDLSNCSKLLDSAFLTIGKFLTDLRTLDLSKTKLTDTALIDIGYRCRMIKKLALEECPNITDRGVLETSRRLAGLQELNIYRTPISDDTVQKLAGTRPNLKVMCKNLEKEFYIS